MATCDKLFEKFQTSTNFAEIQDTFQSLRESLGIADDLYGLPFYKQLKEKLKAWKWQAVTKLLDARANMKEYSGGAACSGQRVLIVGGGPSGLRMAIEAALLGADVSVVEKRNSMTRNNVLHLWPFCIEDLRLIAAKKFYGKFCAGSLDHIGIRQLQYVLLKVALIVGCKMYWKTTMLEIVPPLGKGDGHGWGVTLDPANHPAARGFYDVIIGADGRRSCIPGFARKEFRGKLALAITANFVNHNTSEEAAVEEISGVAFIFNQKFFKDLQNDYGISLENIVYYKDATHYFVMTAKKTSLLEKGVLTKDCRESRDLLRRDNIDNGKLCDFAREAAGFSTALPRLEFEMNKDGKPDVALFDFTSIYAAENSTRIQEKFGHHLMLTLVGDSLLEPFWPMGTGCARSWLSVFDTAWAMKSFAKKGTDPVAVLMERESFYSFLPSTTPEKLLPRMKEYTIDPMSRYPSVSKKIIRRCDAEKLYWTAEKVENIAAPTTPRHRVHRDEQEDVATSLPTKESPPSAVAASAATAAPPAEKTGLGRTGSLDMWRQASQRLSAMSRRVRLQGQQPAANHPSELLTWCKDIAGKSGIMVSDFSTSWSNGMAFCAILHYYLPRAINFSSLRHSQGVKNCQMAFDVAERQLSILSTLKADEMSSADDLAIISYVSRFYEKLSKSEPGNVQTNEAVGILAKKETSSKWRASEKRKPLMERSISGNGAVPAAEPKQRLTVLERIAAQEQKYGGTPVNGDVQAATSASASAATKKDKPSDQVTSAKDKSKFGEEKRSPLFSRKDKTAAQASSSPPPTKKNIAEPKPGKNSKLADGNMCSLCNERVYVVERTTAEGLLFHRRCWRCNRCNVQLRPGTHSFLPAPSGSDQPGKFYCSRHYKEAAGEQRKEPIAGGVSTVKSEPTIVISPVDALPVLRQPVAGQARASPLPEERLSRMLASAADNDSDDEPIMDQATTRKLELKQAQQRRLRAAQQIQFEMGMLEQQQVELEEEAQTVEEALRDPETTLENHELLMAEYMSIVNERNMLVRHEWELSLLFKDLQYEDVRQQIEADLRIRQLVPERLKTKREQGEEAHLLSQLIDLVERRDRLVANTEEERIKDIEMDRAVEDTMRKKGYNTDRKSTGDLRPVSRTPQIPKRPFLNALLSKEC